MGEPQQENENRKNGSAKPSRRAVQVIPIFLFLCIWISKYSACQKGITPYSGGLKITVMEEKVDG
ncbi:hypothetical protein BHS00_08910 [Lactococcus carnosus]|nr:hypothetical protein BHS00_08910 [Lactococcus carnosus]